MIGAWLGEGDVSRWRVTALICAGAAGVASLLGSTQPARAVSIRQREPNGECVPIRRVGSRILAVCVLLLVAGAVRSASEWRALASAEMGPYSGEARLIGDSRAVGQGRRVILEIRDRRYEAWVFGSQRHRVERLYAGDLVVVDGMRRKLDSAFGRRSQVRHIVGRFDVHDVRSIDDAHRRGPMLVRAANRVRGLLSDGAQHLSGDRGALFTGLVYGDDASQSKEMIDRFRASGLAHLTAVSGQNVVFVLTMVSPLLSRLRRPTRVGATVIVLIWFAIMTRLEPSVVRAVIMAGVATVMVALGRPVSSWVALCTTAIAVTLVDPFLIWSIGWWLSVAGCVGLIVLTPAMSHAVTRQVTRCCPPHVAHALGASVVSWIAPTIAAQAGVMAVAVAVFGWPSALSVPCNLLAAPVAGIIMLVGMPIALLAGVLPAGVSHVVMWPIGLGVAWVDSIATAGSRLDPPLAVDVVVSIALVCAAVSAVWGHRATSLDAV